MSSIESFYPMIKGPFIIDERVTVCYLLGCNRKGLKSYTEVK
jgi:hypothetical protein